jgi:hypothetical protein
MTAARQRAPADEQRVDLLLFWQDGGLTLTRGTGRNLPRLEAGRTDSRRGLGFELKQGRRHIRFVLDREQVKHLQQIVWLGFQVGRANQKLYFDVCQAGLKRGSVSSYCSRDDMATTVLISVALAVAVAMFGIIILAIRRPRRRRRRRDEEPMRGELSTWDRY